MLETDDLTWLNCHPEDLWIFDKLILSRVLGYTCGPSGLKVPKPDFYCIRPITNTLGMGRHARIEWIEDSTDAYHPGEFWCEVFRGEHISVDYAEKRPILSVIGIKSPDNPLYKWEKWVKTDKTVEFPQILRKLKGNYPRINCEFIDGHLIEVHLRHNPDFQYGNTEAIPLWPEDAQKSHDSYRYIDSPDYLRKGFFIK